MKSSDYLRAFKNRDLNREIDFAQAKWKEHDHHTFGDFAKWFENQSPPGCRLTIECMCDPELVKRLENIPLVFRKDFSAQVLKANMKVVGNCEYGLILYRDRLPKFNNDGRIIFNCFDWVRDTDTPKIHPTQKPVPLLERLIEIFTDKGDVVIDPCAGSGTTLLAAANMGRKAYGFEIKKDFCAEARVKVLPRISKSLFV